MEWNFIPNALRPGDRIGIVSPSNPVEDIIIRQYTAGLSRLVDFGFEVLAGKYTPMAWGYTASPQQKAEDINAMFANPQVNAIICTQRGITANACLVA